MTTQFPKGAEWRKWDLHLHTPETAKEDRFGGASAWDDYLTKLESCLDIEAVGITDYFSIDNYKKAVGFQADGRIPGKFLFPNVELRILPVTGISKPINFHILFDPKLGPDVIEREFLSKLIFHYDQGKYSCTRKELIALGRAYKCSPNLEEDAAWREGIGQFNITLEQIRSARNNSVLLSRSILGVANGSRDGNSGIQETSGLAAVRLEIYRSSDFIFSGGPKDKEYFLGKGVDSPEEVVKKCGSLKPCFTGSDAHSLKDIGEFSLGRSTWLKADLTFDGLKQALNEPEARVFIGDKPSLFGRIQQNRTRYIRRLAINQVEGYKGQHGPWFENVEILLNPELVAIIGNKGGGKSAIADILALCTNNTPNSDFSFLKKGRFLERGLAGNFNATLEWVSGKSNSFNLGESPSNTELSAKYLPQGQFEKLTNEVSTVEEFQKEIETVVFSHIPSSERLGTETFEDLVKAKTSSVESQLETYSNDVRDLNGKIIKLEMKATESYRTEVENKLRKREEELAALVEPKPMADPNDDSEKKQENEAINKEIEKIRGELSTLHARVGTAESAKESKLEAIQKLQDVKAEVEHKEGEISRYVSENDSELKELGVDVRNLIKIKTDFSEIDTILANKKNELERVKGELGEVEEVGDAKSLPVQVREAQSRLKVETDKLDTEQRRFQAFLVEKEVWAKKRGDVIGVPNAFGTLEYFRHELRYLEKEVSADLETRYEERRGLVRQIFDEKQKVIGVYKEARSRLEKIIKENSATLRDYTITLDASLVKESDFSSRFLGFVLQNKVGTFHSKDGGEAHLSKFVAATDFDNRESVVSFLDKIIAALRNDKRVEHGDAERQIADQVKEIPALYDYLFSLRFLNKNYQLKQGDKGIEQLSPGERGALLLVFYLLLDKSDIPLIIDQPEDNLDNHSVAKILVPFIRAAKKKRQIIMVTHNPNLAVVADAEQVIHVNLNKEEGCVFAATSGSIEDRVVNKKIVEVLEGAMPAFNTRKRKYYE